MRTAVFRKVTLLFPLFRYEQDFETATKNLLKKWSRPLANIKKKPKTLSTGKKKQ